MNTAAPATLVQELDLEGRKYPVIGTIAVLMGPALLFWTAIITVVINILHRHGAHLGVR
jgi:hypothetical protein